MRVLVEVVNRGDGDQQQPSLLGHCKQLGLGLVGAKRADHLATAEVFGQWFLSGEDHVGVVEPVLVASLLVAIALLQGVLHQPISERSDRCAEQVCDRDVAVLAGPEELDFQRPQFRAFGRALKHPGIVGSGNDAGLRRLGVGRLGGDIDELSEPGTLAFVQGHQDANRRLGAGVKAGLRQTDTQRRAVGVATLNHRPGRGGNGHVGGGPAGFGP